VAVCRTAETSLLCHGQLRRQDNVGFILNPEGATLKARDLLSHLLSQRLSVLALVMYGSMPCSADLVCLVPLLFMMWLIKYVSASKVRVRVLMEQQYRDIWWAILLYFVFSAQCGRLVLACVRTRDLND
jgi:hypothetical protein